ncbi:MAG: NAD(P)/FAD-dependent oxidoreductase [Deltaproteobacteria bacterium]|nr:MAG: NAD(P)/FAD-dependent oxidoreductase [Deltaproteobacteria bacterium]
MILRPHLLVGAGPVGLAVAKALAEKGIAYEHVEATDHVGGNWAHGVYQTAHIISSRKTTEYPDWPMPEHYPDFPSAAQMCAYYEAFAEHFGLTERIRFNEEVLSCEPTSSGAWRVRTSRGEHVYAGLIVCNGHHWDRILPDWAQEFSGEVLHSKEYKRPDQLKGKRVLVIGGGNSGCDLASEAARVGSFAAWSLRRGYHFLPKSFLGIPTVEMIHPLMPIWSQRLALKAIVRLKFGAYERYGLPAPDHRIFDEHPTINDDVFHYLSHGKLHPRPDVAHVEGDLVRFTDGTEERFDLVACGTGYRVSFPFLPEGTVPIDHKTPQVLAGMIVPGAENLYVVGAFQPRYGLGPLVRPSATLLARWVQLQAEIEVPLYRVLKAARLKPPTTHLVDPHAAMRQLKRAHKLDPVLRRIAKRLERQAGPRGPAPEAEVAAAK